MAEVVVVVVVDSVVKSDRSGMVRDETETEGPRTIVGPRRLFKKKSNKKTPTIRDKKPVKGPLLIAFFPSLVRLFVHDTMRMGRNK